MLGWKYIEKYDIIGNLSELIDVCCFDNLKNEIVINMKIQEWAMFYNKTSKATFPVVILLSLLMLFNICTNQAFAGSGGLELRIMTFNVRYGTANDGENHWKNRKEMVFDVLRDHKPDIVGLQEALDFQIDEIRKALAKYGLIGVAREDGKRDGEFSCLLYDINLYDVSESGTFWFSNTPHIPGSNHWGNACVRICTWARFIEKRSGKAFYMFNLHLDHVSQPSREKSAVLLTERIKNRNFPDPFIVTGDFNTGENNPVITYLKGRTELTGADGRRHKNPVPMVDTFRVLHPDIKDVRTGHAFRGTRQGNKIDYVFAPSSIKVLEAQILYDNINGRYPSDHYPVNATLRLPANN